MNMAEQKTWQIESLFRKAFGRTKERFLSYIIATIIQYAIVFASLFILVLVLALLGGFLFTLHTSLGTMLGGLLVIAGIIVGTAFMIYISSWSQLTLTAIIIQKKNLGAIETFKQVRPQVWSFVWYNIALNLFLLGLLPFGIISFGLILVLWLFWNVFAVFVFLEQKKTGLDNLWTSRAMVKQNFWAIIGRLVLVFVLFYVIALSLASVDNTVAGIANFLISIAFGPFAVSYMYEIYKLLKVPQKVIRPKGWIGLSAVGYIIVVIMLVVGFSFLVKVVGQVIQSAPKSVPNTMQYPAV